jgi:hypothetical protein
MILGQPGKDLSLFLPVMAAIYKNREELLDVLENVGRDRGASF